MLRVFLFTSLVSAIYVGFNMRGNTKLGECKTLDDWRADIEAIKSWKIQSIGLDSGLSYQQSQVGLTGLNLEGLTEPRVLAIRLFGASHCQDLEKAAQVALETGIKVLPGLWAETSAAYDSEKAAALDVLRNHGCDWIAGGVSIGSEDIHRGILPIPELIASIIDFKSEASKICPGIKVTHSDTWEQWSKVKTAGVVDVVDFIGVTAFPWWERADIKNAAKNLKRDIMAVEAQAKGKEIWITESGWPTAGGRQAPAISSVENAKTWWRTVTCPQYGGLLSARTHFWYEAFDDPTRKEVYEQNFGIASADRVLKFDLAC